MDFERQMQGRWRLIVEGQGEDEGALIAIRAGQIIGEDGAADRYSVEGNRLVGMLADGVEIRITPGAIVDRVQAIICTELPGDAPMEEAATLVRA